MAAVARGLAAAAILSFATCGLPLGQYDEEQAKRMANFAGAAYCKRAAIEAWSCDHCTNSSVLLKARVYYSHVPRALAYVGFGEEGQIIVSFRGTVDINNWIANMWSYRVADADYDACEGCKVHDGFRKIWRSFEKRILRRVKELLARTPQPRVFVTGHSMGGAVATLAAAAMRFQHGIDVSGVYTFGAPRVGNNAFREFYNSGLPRSWRITHYKDPVPHLPPELLNFEHVHTEVYYNRNNTAYRVCDGSGKDLSCARKWGNELALIANHIHDHHKYLGMHVDRCRPLITNDSVVV